MKAGRKKRRVRECLIYNNYWDDAKAKWIRDDIVTRRQEDGDDTEPTEDEIYQEWCDFYDQLLWDDLDSSMKDFLEDKPLIISGYAGLWNGKSEGGKIVVGWEGVREAFNNIDYIKIYEVNGRLCLECSHHDGTNYWEVKEVTPRGMGWYYGHEDEDRRTIVETLFYTKGMSRELRYCQKVWGSPSGGKLIDA